MSTTPAIESALVAMRELAAQAGSGTASRPEPARADSAGGFAGELRESIERINALKVDAAEKSKAFQAGDPSISLNDLMIDTQKASVATQFGIQMRNRLLTAYKEIMRMQV
jgi:flagellar hook-basal body complex protein FliE